MDEKYQQLIEALATKLGTTAEHLWGVLVKQAPISGAVDLMLYTMIVAAVVWWLQLVKRKTTCPPKTKNDSYPRVEWEYETAVLAWISVIIAVLFAVGITISLAQGIVAAFANPEYWALKQLVNR